MLECVGRAGVGRSAGWSMLGVLPPGPPTIGRRSTRGPWHARAHAARGPRARHRSSPSGRVARRGRRPAARVGRGGRGRGRRRRGRRRRAAAVGLPQGAGAWPDVAPFRLPSSMLPPCRSGAGSACGCVSRPPVRRRPSPSAGHRGGARGGGRPGRGSGGSASARGRARGAACAAAARDGGVRSPRVGRGGCRHPRPGPWCGGAWVAEPRPRRPLVRFSSLPRSTSRPLASLRASATAARRAAVRSRAAAARSRARSVGSVGVATAGEGPIGRRSSAEDTRCAALL